MALSGVTRAVAVEDASQVAPARRMGEALAKAGIEVAAAVNDLEGFKNLGQHRV